MGASSHSKERTADCWLACSLWAINRTEPILLDPAWLAHQPAAGAVFADGPVLALHTLALSRLELLLIYSHWLRIGIDMAATAMHRSDDRPRDGDTAAALPADHVSHSTSMRAIKSGNVCVVVPGLIHLHGLTL